MIVRHYLIAIKLVKQLFNLSECFANYKGHMLIATPLEFLKNDVTHHLMKQRYFLFFQILCSACLYL